MRRRDRRRTNMVAIARSPVRSDGPEQYDRLRRSDDLWTDARRRDDLPGKIELCAPRFGQTQRGAREAIDDAGDEGMAEPHTRTPSPPPSSRRTLRSDAPARVASEV